MLILNQVGLIRLALSRRVRKGIRIGPRRDQSPIWARNRKKLPQIISNSPISRTKPVSAPDPKKSILPGTNDWPGDATGTAQSLLGADKHVGDVLVLAQQRNVQQNLQWLAVCGQHNELSLSTVQGLGGLVGSLSDLLVVAGLLNQVQNLGGQCL